MPLRRRFRNRFNRRCIREVPVPILSPRRFDVALSVITEPLTLPPQSTAPRAVRRPKLLFLVTEDWYFCSHRLPVARAARDAGFEVVVATRVRAHGGPIRDEGFALRPIAWRRRGDGLLGAARAIAAITRLYR